MSEVSSHFPLNTVIRQDYSTVDLKAYCKGKKIGLLFSGYWCKPCRELTPEIIKYYDLNKGGTEFEIIYIHADTNETAFRTYFAKMPWLALNFYDMQTNVSENFGLL